MNLLGGDPKVLKAEERAQGFVRGGVKAYSKESSFVPVSNAVG